MVPSSGISEPKLGVATIPLMLFGLIQGTNFGLTVYQPKSVELGTEIARAKLPNGLLHQDVDMAGYVSPQISLPDGRSIGAVIDKIAAVVVKIVREFEPLF
jgi:hypothetical protein